MKKFITVIIMVILLHCNNAYSDEVIDSDIYILKNYLNPISEKKDESISYKLINKFLDFDDEKINFKSKYFRISGLGKTVKVKFKITF